MASMGEERDARGLGGYLNNREHREDLGLDGNIAL